MFITTEQLESRLKSENNILNIVNVGKKEHVITKTPIVLPVIPFSPRITENLPGESNQARAARNARAAINQDGKHGEYTVNPNKNNPILRSTLALLSVNGATSQEIQKEFGVTKNQVTGAVKSKNKDIAEKINHAKNRVSELALDRLMCSMNLLTNEDLATQKPKDLAIISSQLAKVVSSMSRSDEDDKGGKSVNLNIYTPTPRRMEEFAVIEV